MHIRPFNPTTEAYEAIYAVEKAVFPENATTVAEFKHGDASRAPDHFYRRLVVERDGRLIAFANFSRPPQSTKPGRYRLNITVHPDFERQGVGTAVYEQIWQTLQTCDPKPTILESGCYQHHQQSVRFLQKRGFRQVMRWVITRLDIQAFETGPFQPLLDKINAQGIEIMALPQLQARDTDWLEQLHELDWQLVQDEPLPYPPTKMPLDQYRKWMIEPPKALHDSWMVALDNGRYVGNSMLELGSVPGGLSTGYTGVTRPYRRKGLATALKVRSIEYAKQAGYRFIRTGNEEKNPMLLLNKKLGFTEITASLAFEKRLKPGD